MWMFISIFLMIICIIIFFYMLHYKKIYRETKKFIVDIEQVKKNVDDEINQKRIDIQRELDKKRENEEKRLSTYRKTRLSDIKTEKSILVSKIKQEIYSLKAVEEEKLEEYRKNTILDIEKEKSSLLNELDTSIEKKIGYYKFLSILYKILCEKGKQAINNLKTAEREKLEKYRKNMLVDIEKEKTTLINKLDEAIEKKKEHYKFLSILHKVLYEKNKQAISTLKRVEEEKLEKYRKSILEDIEKEKTTLINELDEAIEKKKHKYRMLKQKIKKDINKIKMQEERNIDYYRINMLKSIEVEKN